MNQSILSQIQDLQRTLDVVRSWLESSPAGRVRLRRQGPVEFFTVTTGLRSQGTLHEHYVSLRPRRSAGAGKATERGSAAGRVTEHGTAAGRVTDEAVLCARKYYAARLLPVLERELASLKTLQADYFPQDKFRVYDDLPPAVQSLVSPLFVDARQRAKKWAEEPYLHSEFPFDESNCYMMRSGVRVRSRAEMIIGEQLSSLGLFYRYECAYVLPDGRTVCPDFTIMHPETGELYYLEYFGLMSDSNYAASALAKIRAYQQTADAPRFIYLFESATTGLDVKHIQNVLSCYFGGEQY